MLGGKRDALTYACSTKCLTAARTKVPTVAHNMPATTGSFSLQASATDDCRSSVGTCNHGLLLNNTPPCRSSQWLPHD